MRRRLVALLVLGALVAGGCGSRREDAELFAATRGEPGSVPAGGGETADAGSGTGATTRPGSTGGGSVTPGTTGTGGGSTGTGTGSGSSTGGTTPAAGGQTPTGGGGGAATGGGGAAASCTGDESTITIGSVGQQSGVFGPFMQPIAQGLQAWVRSVNANGGVRCHPIELIVKDDGGDPSVHQAQVQELVEQRDAIALVATTAVLTGNASVDYLTNRGVPVIGNEGGSEWTYDSPVFFPQMTTGNTALAALVGAIAQVGKPQGKTKLAVVTCLEAALCSSLFGEADALAQRAGLDLVSKGQASLTQPDFTGACQNAKSAGAELFIIGLDTNSIQRVLRNCESIGYRPIYITGGPLVTPALLADPRAEGFLVSSATDLYTDTANPEVAAFVDAMATYAPGIAPSIASMAGWTAGKLFEKALTAAADVTRPALLESLGSIRDDDLGGLTYPLTFTPGQPPPRVSCVWIGQVSGGTLVPADGTTPGRFCE